MCGKQEMAELCTHRDTRFPAPCPLNTGVFTFNSKQQQQPAAFPTAPSITRQSLTRVFQWLLCQHRNKEPSPAICCPCYGWLSAHSDKAWLCTTSSHSASVPSPTGGRFGRWEGQGAGVPGLNCELTVECSSIYYGFHQWGRQVTARFTCVGQRRPRVCCKPAKTGKVISPVTATNWNHDVRGAGPAALINQWQGSICRADKPHQSKSRSLAGLIARGKPARGCNPFWHCSLLRFPGQALNTSKADAKTVLGSQSVFKGAW